MDPPSSKSTHYQVSFKMFVEYFTLSARCLGATDNAVAGGTFLSLIPLPTEEEVLLCLLHYLHHSKFTRIYVILDPPKFHYQQLKNNSGCLSTGLPP
jgi:hypothetical protein